MALINPGQPGCGFRSGNFCRVGCQLCHTCPVYQHTHSGQTTDPTGFQDLWFGLLYCPATKFLQAATFNVLLSPDQTFCQITHRRRQNCGLLIKWLSCKTNKKSFVPVCLLTEEQQDSAGLAPSACTFSIITIITYPIYSADKSLP